jgi:pimeloyl-ACP methyl ester carboxylesterase
LRQIRFQLLTLGVAGLLVACGGGTSYQSITGLAATGAALAGAAVTGKCGSGSTLTGMTNAEGEFRLVLSNGQTMPCMLQVVKGDTTLHSIALDSGRNNVTPLSDLVVTKALGSDPAAAFASFDATKGSTIKAGLDAAKTYVKSQVTDLTGGAPAGDILTGSFKVGDADDKVLDNLTAKLATTGKKLDDLRQGSVLGGSLTASLDRGVLIDPAMSIYTLPAVAFDAGQLAALTGPAKCDVKVVPLNYKTIGVSGEKTNASGVLLLPSGANCTKPAGLVAYAKGTDVQKLRTLANPGDSETLLLAAMYAAQGYAVVATDYLGFAKSEYPYHPYLHADSEASSVIDSIRAARKAANALSASLSGKVMLAGYSQGGHASMAAHRAIERDNAAEINVVAGAHLAGPYNMSGSLKSSAVIAGYQFFVPYLVTAWQKVYGTVYSRASDVFKDPYAGYIETLLPSATLDYTTLVTSQKLPGINGETPTQARDAMFQLAYLTDAQTNEKNGLYLAGKKNDLLGWSPKSMLMLCGGAGDPTVPPALHQAPMKADFDSRKLSNVSTVDVDAYVQATYGAVLQNSPATYYGNYHGTYEPPFCHAQAKGLFDKVSAN